MWYTKGIDEVLSDFGTNINTGLMNNDVEERKKQFGKNEIIDKKKENVLTKFIKQFNDFMIIVLIIASIGSAMIAKFDGSNDYIDSIIIITIVILNAIMGVIQETKAEKSIEALKKLTSPMTKVIRNKKEEIIKSEELVPGDIVVLETGYYVPADIRLLKTSNLKIDESSLTGEVIPSEKDEKIILNESTALGDMINMAFSGSLIVNGHGIGIVTKIGMDTKVGKIANIIMKNDITETPLQRKLTEVGKTLGISCLVICLFIFIIGIFKKIPPLEMFMTAIGLAVAAIPEGLPAVVTIMLSIGVTQMAKKNSIIRKLPAVETLGGASVICSDKTGTLTQNKMTVTEIKSFGAPINEILRYGSMCTDTKIEYENGKYKVLGEPTEVAIVNAALKDNINSWELYNEIERISDIPFDSKRKMMSTIYKMKNNNRQYIMITKGAPDILINKCEKYFDGVSVKELSLEKVREMKKYNKDMAGKALRVIAVAYKMINDCNNLKEDDLCFLGLIGMIDPPRKGVKEAVDICSKAGIKTVMITGDHIETAKAIAKQIGILKRNDLCITGEELAQIPQNILKKNIMKYSVFARISPEDKERIVEAFQSNEKIVAMTGDGINDSPALKKADIGIAMGKNGTDVAKNAADMILVDDNFTTIVEAVKQGRNIYDNIRKSLHFLISTNIGEIVVIFIGILLGLKSPLIAIQLLWINLVTDSLPGIAIGLQPADKTIMNRKPRNNNKGIFSNGLWGKIILEGMMIGSLTLVAFSIGNNIYSLEVGRTMAFISLGISELVHSFNIKSEESIFKVRIF